jgi:ActR/RegA family two-component response regulator
MKSTNVKSQSDRTVCLMEDDGPTLEVWQETVKECGGVAAVARNPDHVVALAEKGVRHFILDCHMGSADRSEEGLNALERLKDKYSDARVGILTGYNQYKPKAMRLKPDHFLVKSGNHQTDVRSMLTESPADCCRSSPCAINPRCLGRPTTTRCQPCGLPQDEERLRLDETEQRDVRLYCGRHAGPSGQEQRGSARLRPRQVRRQTTLCHPRLGG